MAALEPPVLESRAAGGNRALAARGPTWRERVAGRKWLWGSVAFHVLLALGFMVWKLTPEVRARKAFLKPGSVAETARQGSELKVSLGKKQSVMSAPEQAKRVTTTSNTAQIALPEMALIAERTTEVFAGRPSGLGGTGAGAGPLGQGAGGAGKGGTIDFFQLRMRAKSVVFLVDLSSSMVMSYIPPRVPGKAAPEKIVKDEKSYAVMEREVVRVIQQLDPGIEFSMICFAGEVAPYRRGMGAATEAEKGKAIQFLQERSPAIDLILERKRMEQEAAGFKPGGAPKSGSKFNHGGTQTAAALEAAFALNPDVICLVSDGVPSDKSSAAILAMVEQRQRELPRPAVINVIAYLADSGQEFMRELADKNQGSYKEIKPGAGSAGL